MKKIHFVYCFLGCMATYIICTSSSLGRATDDNVGNTGAPGETTLCSNCHNNGAYGTVSLSIQIFEVGTNTPVPYYVPNATYDMRVQVSPSAGSPLGYGFQLTAMRNTNVPYAAYSNLGSNVKQKLLTSGAQSGRTYLEQNGVLNNNQFNFRWTAPTAGTGNINFYASGVACNDNNSSGGDRAGNSSLLLPEAPQLQVLTDMTSPTCNGDTDGAIIVSVVTGVAPYSFLWEDGSTDQNRSGLAAGTYSVTVTDNLGQVFEDTIVLNEPLALSNFIDATQPTLFGGNGMVEVFVSGGTGPYTLQVNGEPSPLVFEPVVGQYNVLIEDANGCQIIDEFSIVAPPAYQIIASTTAPLCSNSEDGSIALDVSGAFPPYTIEWQDGAVGSNRNDLGAGNYVVDITDQYGNSITQEVVLTAPPSLVLDYQYEPLLCFGDQTTLTISATGGTAPYSGIGSSFVQAGSQALEVADANGCIATETIEISSPAVLSGSEILLNISCAEGNLEVEVVATGGTPPYFGVGMQTITNPGSYLYPIEDSNGCGSETVVNVITTDGPQVNSVIEPITCAGTCTGSIALAVSEGTGQFVWSDGFEGAVRENLCSGDYTCTFISEDGCNIVNQFVLEDAPPLIVLANYTDSICAGSLTPVDLSITGGAAPYTVLWDGAEVSISHEAVAGQYNIEVQDTLLCVVGLTVEIGEYSPIELLANNVVNATCNGASDGAIQLNAISASGDITYGWLPNVSDSASANNLDAGEYLITLTDVNGCSETTNITITEPSVLDVDVTVNDTFAGIGTLVAEGTGGTPPYLYAWSNGSTQEQIEVTTGFYSLTLTDDAGCQVIEDGLEIATSVAEIWMEHMRSYPNPFDGMLHIKLRGDYRIVNPMGQVYHEGSGAGDIDTNRWPNGVYYLMQPHQEAIRLVKN